ncbi:MAG TPA: glutamate racemase [Rugosibacter sp.]
MIGVFDSGLGGLSVLAALVDTLPHTDFIYFADTAHVPYGNKSDAEIQARVLAIGDHLADAGCKLLVVACNTATATAVEALRQAHPNIPVVGVEPGIKPAAQTSISRRIAVLTTEATARSARLAQLIRHNAAEVEVFIEPCPGWATHVEQLQLDDPALIKDIRHHVLPLLEKGVDRLVLGCTHYSFLVPALQKIVADKAVLIDVADAVARQTKRLMSALGETPATEIAKPGTAQQHATGLGRLYLKSSSHPEQIIQALPKLSLQYLIPRLIPND